MQERVDYSPSLNINNTRISKHSKSLIEIWKLRIFKKFSNTELKDSFLIL